MSDAGSRRKRVDPKKDEPREGRYANHLEVGRNAEEVVMDFGQVFDGDTPLIHTRIVTHPVFAQQMVEALRDSLSGPEEGRERRTQPRSELRK